MATSKQEVLQRAVDLFFKDDAQVLGSMLANAAELDEEICPVYQKDTDGQLKETLKAHAGVAEVYSLDDWTALCCGTVLADGDDTLAHLPKKLVAAGIRSPFTVAMLTPPAIAAKLGLDEKTDGVVVEQFEQLCGLYAKRYTLKELLTRGITGARISTFAARSSQSNRPIYGKAQKLTVWHGFGAAVGGVLQEIPETRSMFRAYAPDPTKNSAGEVPCDRVLSTAVLPRLNVAMRYHGFTEQGLSEDKMYQWQQQARSSTTDSQYSDDSEGEDAKDIEETLASEELMRTIDQSSMDHVALRRPKGLKTASLYEMMCGERLSGLSGYSAEQLVQIYQGELDVGGDLRKNLQEAISQVNYYAGLHGCRYVMFGCFTYTWVVHYEVPNCPMIAGPFKYDSRKPYTLLQIMYALGRLAVGSDGKLPKWTPPGVQRGGTPGSRSGSRPSSRRGSTADDPDTSNAAECQVGGASVCGLRRPRGQSSQPPAKKQHATGDSVVYEQLDCDQAAVVQPPLPASELEVTPGFLTSAAARINIRYPQRILGRGISGPVYMFRLDDIPAAVKVARDGTCTAQALAHEAAVYLALQPLWDKCVPRLLAAGHDLEQLVFVLATKHIPARHLNPTADEHLLPQLQEAVAAVHSHEVLHNDLRAQNVLVAGEGQQRVWLIDFGHARQGATPQELSSEMASLTALFSRSAC